MGLDAQHPPGPPGPGRSLGLPGALADDRRHQRHADLFSQDAHQADRRPVHRPGGRRVVREGRRADRHGMQQPPAPATLRPVRRYTSCSSRRAAAAGAPDVGPRRIRRAAEFRGCLADRLSLRQPARHAVAGRREAALRRIQHDAHPHAPVDEPAEDRKPDRQPGQFQHAHRSPPREHPPRRARIGHRFQPLPAQQGAWGFHGRSSGRPGMSGMPSSGFMPGGEGPRYGVGGGSRRGGGMGGYADSDQLDPDERDPLDLPVEIDGIIYIFNVPKREKLGTGTVATAAAAATAPAAVKTPAAPGPTTAVPTGVPAAPAQGPPRRLQRCGAGCGTDRAGYGAGNARSPACATRGWASGRCAGGASSSSLSLRERVGMRERCRVGFSPPSRCRRKPERVVRGRAERSRWRAKARPACARFTRKENDP